MEDEADPCRNLPLAKIDRSGHRSLVSADDKFRFFTVNGKQKDIQRTDTMTPTELKAQLTSRDNLLANGAVVPVEQQDFSVQGEVIPDDVQIWPYAKQGMWVIAFRFQEKVFNINFTFDGRTEVLVDYRGSTPVAELKKAIFRQVRKRLMRDSAEVLECEDGIKIAGMDGVEMLFGNIGGYGISANSNKISVSLT